MTSGTLGKMTLLDFISMAASSIVTGPIQNSKDGMDVRVPSVVKGVIQNSLDNKDMYV